METINKLLLKNGYEINGTSFIKGKNVLSVAMAEGSFILFTNGWRSVKGTEADIVTYLNCKGIK